VSPVSAASAAMLSAKGRIWEDGSKTLEGKQAGMMFQGTNQIAANYVSDNQVQKTSVQMISGQKAVSQFGDRDTDPAMAAAAETAIQQFIANPTASTIKSIQSSLAAQAKTIF
jgi:predicted nucleotidyltransferase